MKDKDSNYKEFIGDGLLYFLLRLWCYKNKIPFKECVRLNIYFNTNQFFAYLANNLKISNASTQFKLQKESADLFEEFICNKYLKEGLDKTYEYYGNVIFPFIEKQTVIKYRK